MLSYCGFILWREKFWGRWVFFSPSFSMAVHEKHITHFFILFTSQIVCFLGLNVSPALWVPRWGANGINSSLLVLGRGQLAAFFFRNTSKKETYIFRTGVPFLSNIIFQRAHLICGVSNTRPLICLKLSDIEMAPLSFKAINKRPPPSPSKK